MPPPSELLTIQARQARQRFGSQVIALLPQLVQELRVQLTAQVDQARSARDHQTASDALTLLNQSERTWIHGVQASLKKFHQQSIHPPATATLRCPVGWS